jgi:CheY-like chemotaxis protein
MGQSVRTVGDAAEALASVQSEKPDLVISDLALPHMDGYELARRLRVVPGLATLPIVALTGYGQESDKQRAKEAGFDFHLVKPVSLEALQHLLAALPAPSESRIGDPTQQRTTR